MNISKSTLRAIIGLIIVALVVCVIWLFVKIYAPAVDPVAFLSGGGLLL